MAGCFFVDPYVLANIKRKRLQKYGYFNSSRESDRFSVRFDRTVNYSCHWAIGILNLKLIVGEIEINFRKSRISSLKLITSF